MGRFASKIIMLFGFFFFIVFFGALLEFRSQIPTMRIERQLSHNLQSPDVVKLLAVGNLNIVETGNPALALLEKLCASEHPDAIFLQGNNFFEHGVESLEDTQWKAKFEDQLNSECLRHARFYVTLGNKDYEHNPTPMIAYTRTQNRWTLPSRYYAVAFGNLLDVFVIDTNFPDKCGFAKSAV